MTRKKHTKSERRLAVDNIDFRNTKLTVGDVLALNEAARRTCEFEATSQVGELA